MRETIKKDEADKIAKRFFFSGKNTAANQLERLKWAVDFAQRPGGIEERKALTLFPDGMFNRSQIELFSEEETKEVRNKVSAMLNDWIKNGYYEIKNMPKEVFIQNDPAGPSLRLDRLEEAFGDNDLYYLGINRAVHNVAFLLAREGHRVKKCDAPARYKPGEKCGRIFVGRLNQDYCSHLCQMRDATKRKREKPKGGKRHGRKVKK